jgi:predicted nucleic acid-binding protein
MNSPPSGLLLFDTCAYIRNIRFGSYAWLTDDDALFLRTVLTVVVAAELYAGARSSEDKKDLDTVCRRHQMLGMLSCPPSDTWVLAGVLLQRYARLHGDIRYADHFRDALIALEACRHDATVLTENARDFLRWGRLLRSAGKTLKVFELRRLAAR